MFPIHNEHGKVIAFGGRALSPDENAKYLNSPETPIYKKSYTLYNLHRAKDAIRKEERAILVEGYMDAIGVSAAGMAAVVASCGTALTAQQIQALKRHAVRIVVNFDPDAAGAKAAERSIGLLLQEGMQVRIMELEGGLDPDEYCKEHGADAYRERLEKPKAIFTGWRTAPAAKYDVHTSEGVVSVLQFLLPEVQRISDRLERMAIVNDVADLYRRKAGHVARRIPEIGRRTGRRRLSSCPQAAVRPDERGLIHVLISNAEGCERLIEDLARLETLDRLDTRRILQAIIAVHSGGGRIGFDAVAARLEDNDRRILAEMLFAEDPAVEEFGLEWGRKCIARLRRCRRAPAILAIEGAHSRIRARGKNGRSDALDAGVGSAGAEETPGRAMMYNYLDSQRRGVYGASVATDEKVGRAATARRIGQGKRVRAVRRGKRSLARRSGGRRPRRGAGRAGRRRY